MKRAAAALLAAAAMAFAACSPPAVETPSTETPPAEPVITAETPMSAAQLVDCAGALAASGDIDPSTPPTTDTPASNAVWTILALLDKELEYGTANAGKGRAAVLAAREAWKAKPPAELAAKTAACTLRFPA